MGWYGGFAPYVSVAERKKKAQKKMLALKKKGHVIAPVVIEGRTIAKTVWGKAWCTHLESYSDYDNRLPRGRTYVRNGSVLDLQVSKGEINALVNGSSMYNVKIGIGAIVPAKWKALVKACVGQIDSLIELLQGKFSKGVMEVLSHPEKGLFPSPNDIKLSCSCPDWAQMCKHVAAVLYGVGARLDEFPEVLFLLRQVDHTDLITQASKPFIPAPSTRTEVLSDTDLSTLFGIEIEGHSADDEKTAVKRTVKKPVAKKVTARKSVAKTRVAASKVAIVKTPVKKVSDVKAAAKTKTVKAPAKKRNPAKTVSKTKGAVNVKTVKTSVKKAMKTTPRVRAKVAVQAKTTRHRSRTENR